MSTASLTYRSAAFTSKPEGRMRLKFAETLPRSNPVFRRAWQFDQEFSVAASGYPPPAQNTPATNASFSLAAFTPPNITGVQSAANAILITATQPNNPGADLLRYTASFAVVPESFDDYQTQLVNFPGWLNNLGPNFRDPKPVEVNVRFHYEFFVIDPDNLAAGVLDSGGNAINRVTSKGAIPILRRTPWLVTYPFGTPLPNYEAKSLTPAAGLGGYFPTLPTIEQYQSWCGIATAFYAALAAGTATWDETHPPIWDGASSADITSGQYRLANSRLQDYAGNIVTRVTTYALVE
jgi:hypothetical protein